MMKFTKEKARSFSRNGIYGLEYLSKDDFSSLTCSLIEVNGRHGRIRSTVDDRLYFVLEGQGRFMFEGKTIDVRKHDAVIVPKETAYDYEGRMSLLLVNSPAFEPGSDIELEERHD
jgi:mannose-6-phosphate isomerase-like protein (cupin superfamily)